MITLKNIVNEINDDEILIKGYGTSTIKHAIKLSLDYLKEMEKNINKKRYSNALTLLKNGVLEATLEALVRENR